MSKNIVMQQKTADGYEELYPKANGDGSVIVNNTTNQFLGGGSTVGDALEYLSKFGMYWWKKVYQQPNYAIKYNETANNYVIYEQYVTYPNLPNQEGYSTTVRNQDTLVLYTSLNCDNNGSIYGDGAINVPVQIMVNVRNNGGNNRGYASYYFFADGAWTTGLPDNYYIQRSVGFLKTAGYSQITAPTGIRTNAGSQSLLTTISQKGYMANSYISSYTTTTTYICSSDPNAYPDQGNTDSSGAKYWKVGQPWEFLPKLGKVETGYYTGTGSGNVTLTFENAPQFLFAQRKDGDGGSVNALLWCKDVTYMVRLMSNKVNGSEITQSGNSLIINYGYLNDNAVAYQYFAITQ